MKESFVFYKSFYESIKEVDDNIQLELFKAICEYSLNDEEIELAPISRALFTLMKPIIDSAKKRYVASVENGKKGGAPKGNQNAKKQPKNNLEQPNNNLTKTQKQSKNNLNDNVNVNDNVNDNDNINIYSPAKVEQLPYKEIIDYLNFKTNSNYKHTLQKTKDLIKARINNGFTIEDFKKVIDKKTQEWLGTDFEKFLRPETLFGNKFEGYLNQKIKGGSSNVFLDIMKDDYDNRTNY